jgi:hypothetical protein
MAVVPLGQQDEEQQETTRNVVPLHTKPPVAAYHPVFTFQNTGSRSTLHICTIEIYAFLSAHSIASLIDSCCSARFLVFPLSLRTNAQLHTDPLTADEASTQQTVGLNSQRRDRRVNGSDVWPVIKCPRRHSRQVLRITTGYLTRPLMEFHDADDSS